jgi:hypothetical protein
VHTAASVKNRLNEAISVGFVAGCVRHDDLRHSEVQPAQRLQAAHPDHLRFAVKAGIERQLVAPFSARWISTTMGTSRRQKSEARIIQFGDSWRGAPVISLAHELQQENIPILLIIQVDNIAKPEQDDRVVPQMWPPQFLPDSWLAPWPPQNHGCPSSAHRY